jgi:hypothetical protein
MPCDQTTSSAATINTNTDIYIKYDTVVIPTIVTVASSLPNDLDKSVVYPTMFDRWRDI